MSIQMASFTTRFVALLMVPLVAGCAATPMGPTVPVMPAPYKPFEVFRQDQTACTDYAERQVAGLARMANGAQVATGVAATVLGAGLGAAIGGGRGAAIGAAEGAMAGTIIGAGGSERSQADLQQRYDAAYTQCMYGHGNQVPGFAPINSPPPPPVMR
jgi:hypothetical protein